VRQNFPQIRTIQLDQNYGFCGGYNKALKQVVADYYVLLNSDIEVTPQWLAPMIQLLDDNLSVAAVQPKVLSYHNKNKFEHAGAAGGFIDSLGYPFCRGRVFDYVEEDHGQYNDQREIFWATGACLMIRSEVFRKFDGFDEDFFAHMEEIDLCWKVQRSKHKVFYCGSSTIYHVGAGTLSYRNPKKVFLNFRNGLSLLVKHLNTGELIYKLPLRIALDVIAAFQFLLKGEGRSFAAVIRAHGKFLLNLSNELKKRKELRETLPTYPEAMIYKGSVVVDYFLKGQRVYKV
ncbi:MAG TPA: glycosyltransferase family 2 protein, partial [Chryseolinea sp.]|nr:glycosyltransferase family 2 protein [Chryseolinea sp.]